MVDNEMFFNYKRSLEQKYNAVCFDIDGTLTEENSRKIDIRAIEMIADLLKRKIPVVFITGRGELGLDDLRNDIYFTLKNKYSLSNSELRRIYVLLNDGARLFFSLKEDVNAILRNSVYISTQAQLDELKRLDFSIAKYISSEELSDICDLTYSKDLKTNKIINLRLVFENASSEIADKIYNTIQNILVSDNLNSLFITRGFYKGKTVLQIGTAKKDDAIKKAEQIIGVPRNSMMRIGDCGDIKGNDYSMLNCKQGYSVNKISGSDNSCFPIFDERGMILKGVEATLHLVKSAKLLPTVCLEKADKKDYTFNYARVERDIILGRNKILNRFNEIINRNFNIVNGIDDLFDKYSGSVIIPMYEWELIVDNPLKELWSIRDNEKLLYSMRDNDNYLLRGSKTYYYLLANRKSIDEIDKTDVGNVLEWYYNYLEFFKRSSTAVENTIDVNVDTNKKMILGILDNIRNVLLVLINHKLQSKYMNQNVLLNLDSNVDNDFFELYNILLQTEKLMSNICFTENYKVSKFRILDVLNSISKRMHEEFISINMKEIDYSKEYRAYREIDNFAENYITLVLNNSRNLDNEQFNVCGLSYGGIELPVLHKAIDDNTQGVFILKFNKKVSGYTNKQLIELRKFDIKEYGGIIGIDGLKNKMIAILDDNVLTGKTLQLAINSLYDYGIEVRNIGIVRYPSINRIDQMFMNNHGAVDYNLFFDYITGLCFKSPYSWRDENKLHPYKDSLGVFDLNRKKILECLAKNHDYKECSEVIKCKRRIIE